MSVQESTDALDLRRQGWVAVVNAGDVDGYLALLSEDVVWIPPAGPALHGPAAFRAWVEPFFENFSYRFHLTDVSLRLAGDWAVERGAFRSRLTPRGGGSPAEHVGRYTIIWRREPDGVWRIERYVDETESG